MNRRLLAASIAVLLCLPTCAGMKNTDRSRRLTVLAAQEAASIADADSRLTLQLNIASSALDRFEPEDGQAILVEVAKTLRSEREFLPGRARLSGWVSASQLSRRAKNPAAAAEATRAAAQELDDLRDLVERCQYLLGVAEEVRLSQGDAAAVELLTKGGLWANAIDNREERRQARLAFADALLEMSAFDNAVVVLRGEKDATWSSSSLLALAAMPQATAFVAEAPASPAADRFERAVPMVMAPAAVDQDDRERQQQSSDKKRSRMGYGKAVDFGAVFQGRSSSQR